MKRGIFVFILLFILALFILAFSQSASAFLGISPAKQTANFIPGEELEYKFNVVASPETRIELYAREEFSELVRFDKKVLVGGGSFTVRFKLPMQIEKPGAHRLIIGAREVIDEEVGGLGTAVAVQAPIFIIVPYPGKYATVSIIASNVNVGEKLQFQVMVSSMGKEPITALTSINIYSGDKKVETLDLGAKYIESQSSATFRKSVNADYKPGEYEAVATVQYDGQTANASLKFKVGYLFVNITDYTREIVKEGIQQFKINVQSLWNNPIANVYGIVDIIKNGSNISSFSTPSIKLEPWETNALTGYLETEKLETEYYGLKVRVDYEDKFTEIEGKLKVSSKLNIYYVVAAILTALIIILILLRKLKNLIKYGKEKGKRKK